MTKKILKIAGYTVGLLLFLIVVIAGLTQSKLFKDRLRIFIVSAITTNTNGTLSLGTIRGNFVTGFTVDSLVLRTGGEDFISTGQIEISYDILSLMRRKLIIHRLSIDTPKVLLEHGSDGLWNVQRLGRPTSDTSSPSAFDWTIQVNELTINGGTFILRDPMSLASPGHPENLPHQVEYHDLKVSNINLRCGGRYVGESAYLQVENLSFESRTPGFVLQHLGGEFSVSPDGVEAKSMKIRTAGSSIQMDAALQDVSLFDGIELEQLQRKPVRLTLAADPVDLNELKSFLPPVDFLNGTASLELEARGEFGNLRIQRLNLRTLGTSLRLVGSIHNLHRPEDLFIQAGIHDSQLIPGDAARLLPPFNIPPFERVGVLQLNAQFAGTPLHFTAGVSLSGEEGDLHAEANLNLKKNPMEYTGELRSRNLHISRFFGSFPEQTFLTVTGSINGAGLSFRTMTAAANFSLDSSVVQSMLLQGSAMQADARSGKLHAAAKLASRDTKLSLDANADFTDSGKTSFDAEADIAALDLAKILNDFEHQSSLSFHTSISGSWSNPDDLSGRLRLDFSPSSYQAHDFPDGVVTLVLDQKDPHQKSLEVASPAADVRISGTFSLQALTDGFEREFHRFTASLRQPSSLFEGATVSRMLPPEESPSRPFAVQYSISLKNLHPVSLFLGKTPFNARGLLEGSVSSDNKAFALTCSMTVNELFIGTVEKGVFIDGGSGSIELLSRKPNPPQETSGDYIDGLTLTLKTHTAFGIVNTRTLDNSMVSILLKRGIGHIEARSRIDSLATVAAQGALEVSESRYVVVLDTLTALFRSLMWSSEKGATISVDRSGVRLSDLELRRSNERVSLHGILQPDGTIDASLAVRRFDLSGIGEYSGAKELQGDRGFSGNLDLDLDVQGTTGAPRIHLASSCANFVYRGREAGSFKGLFAYENQNLDVDVRLTSGVDGTSKSDLSLIGNIPVDLGIHGVEKRFPDHPMSLTLSSQEFDAGLLDPLIASVDELRGRLSCDVRIRGTPEDPLYNGAVVSPEVRFLFVPNNLTYFLKGKLEASEDRINLAGVQISNNPDDERDGTATVDGSLTIRNFAVESFDLTANGQLLLLKESSRRSTKGMYGRLFAGIGSDGLRFRGSFSRSYLAGSIYVREANLIFPPTDEEAYSTGEASLNYIVVDDTSTTDLLKEQLTEQFYRANAGGRNETPGGTASTREVRTLWDGMEYDIQIETQGTTEIRMIFNQATNEELYAELDGKVVLQRRRQRGAHLAGEIAISDRSYYNFFKRFKAGGTLKFVGQHDNPELNITAKYEGTKRLAEADTLAEEVKVVVTLAITGTRYEPKIDISMTVDGDPWMGDAESDAISFILTGKFKDDLTSREKSDLATSVGASAGASLLYGSASQMLSGTLSEFLRNELGFIHSAEVSYQGGSLQETADLRLSGELGRAYWRFGGRIFNDIGNANVSFQLSMGEVLSAPPLRNLFIELERKVEGTEYIDQKKLTNTARIFYRFSF